MSPLKTTPLSKAQEAFNAITGMASELQPKSKLPTIRQLQRRLGISIATLDKVLTQLEAQNIIYRRQGSGIYVSPYLHQKTVGLICTPEFFRPSTNSFWSELVETVRQRSSLDGEIFRFYLGLPASRSHIPVHEDLQEDIAARRLDGVLFVGNNLEAVEWLEKQGVAVVNFAGRAHHQVVIGYEDLMQRAVTALARAGCHRIGLMSPFQSPPEHDEIRQFNATDEFRTALLRQQLAFFPEFVWDADNIPDIQSQTYHERGFAAVRHIFGTSNTNLPDGLVVLDEMMTSGVLACLKELNFPYNTNLRITSHSNRKSSTLQGVEQHLLLFEIDPADIVQTMFSMLHILLEKKTLEENIKSIKAHPRGSLQQYIK